MTTLQEQTTSQARTGSERPVRHGAPFRPHVIAAVFLRNFASYFSNPAGYVFITLFVFVSAIVAFWRPEFFSRNLANLDTLNGWMHLLLLFFIPAVTMSAWAEERRQGTDELLLTLPAHDVDVVLGKYFAAVGIYTVALGFSVSLVAILAYIGTPDAGVVFASYLGYWLMGLMLIAIGLVASSLSANVTLAFILGAVFCALPIFARLFGSPFGQAVRRQFEDLSVPAQFQDFGTGTLPLSGVFYFVSFALGMLYVNMLVLGRRHWAGGEKSARHWLHALIRATAVVVALASLNVLTARMGMRFDASAGRLNTLSKESVALLKQIPKDRPVYIQAYYSPEAPKEFVETKSDLLRLLRECAAYGGDRIRLNLVETELYSPQARDAEKRFGIEPRRVMTTDDAKQASAEFYLGVAFSSGLDEVVIPFFDRGLPVEYELIRSIRVVSRSARKKVGILSTDAKLLGGFDMRSFGQNPEWSIVTELKKQYDVSSVSPDATIPTDLDVLLVAQPSALTQRQIDNLTTHVRNGGPTLLFLDPFPVENPQLAPEVPRQSPGGPFGGGPPPEPKGDLRPLLDSIGLDWPSTEIVWNDYNPLQQRPDLPPEIVFVGKGSGAKDAFNPEQAATSGLQEVVVLFAGLLKPKGGGNIEFTPLLRTNNHGGALAWGDVAQQGFMGVSGINPRRRHFPSGTAYTLAARIEGTPAPEPADQEKGKEKKAEKPAKVNLIAIADLDLISEQFFDLRRQKVEDLKLDNVTFVLNCVDVLAGDDSFVGLRKKRLEHRTLTRLEGLTAQFDKQRLAEAKSAEEAADEQLKIAQNRLNKQVDEISERKDLDERTKEIMLANLRDVANRRLEVEKTKIEDEKRRKIQESKAVKEQKVREIENMFRTAAIVIPPLPALLLGLIVFLVRFRVENRGANPNRLA